MPSKHRSGFKMNRFVFFVHTQTAFVLNLMHMLWYRSRYNMEKPKYKRNHPSNCFYTYTVKGLKGIK